MNQWSTAGGAARPRRSRTSTAVLVGLAFVGTVYVVAFGWVWVGQWTTDPDAYRDASDWWWNVALPRAAWSLLLGLPLACLVALVVRRLLTTRS